MFCFQAVILFRRMCRRLHRSDFLARQCCHHFVVQTMSSYRWTFQEYAALFSRTPCIVDTTQVVLLALIVLFLGWAHWIHRCSGYIQQSPFQCHLDSPCWWLNRSRLDWGLVSLGWQRFSSIDVTWSIMAEQLDVRRQEHISELIGKICQWAKASECSLNELVSVADFW